MKKIKHLVKLLTVHSIIFSMVQTSFFITPAQAEITGSDIQSFANIALGTYGSFLGQQQQIIQQQIMSQKNAALMQRLSPSCTNPDGTFCYRSAGKYFPECPLPLTMSNKPKNVCSETIPDASQSAVQISNMLTYEAIAHGWSNYYEQMSNEATNATYPAGLKCLTDKAKKLDSEMIEMINNLTRLQDQLKREKEVFKANNQKLLEELSQANDELLGVSKNNLAVKTTPFASLFSSSCQSVIGENNIAAGFQKGLLGIQQEIAPANKRAADYNRNRTAIESEVRSDITKIQNSIANGGLQDYFDGKVTETSKFKSLGVAAEKQKAEFNLAKERISKEMTRIGYTIPTMDKNFSIDFDEFLKGSTTFFKNTYIKDCVTGADKSGMAISTNQILNNLQQKSTNSSGTARDKYKKALENILNSDSFIEDKLAEIRALESTYKDITITYQSGDGQRVTETPYDLYIRTLSKCEQRYSQDDTFSANGSNGVSQKKKVDRGQALLRELKSLHDNFSSQFSSKALEQVLSCNGETKKSGSSCGSAKSFDHTDDSFCMNHASQCANEVNGCYAEATKLVEIRKTKMDSLAKKFNANAEMMVNRSNQLFNMQKANVMQMVKIIQGRFPGTNFPIPEDMFISMPVLKKDKYGVDMANDGDMAFMDELPKKIDSLKKIFKDQKEKVNEEIGDYVGKQKAAMSTQKAYWDSLANECKGSVAKVSSDLAKYNADGQKRQAEQDQKTINYCRKYTEMTQNPNGACNGADKLAEEADEISARISNRALSYTRRFRDVCNQFNNESDDAEIEAPDYCESNGSKKLLKYQLIECENVAKRRARKLEKQSVASNGSATSSRISLYSLCKGDSNDDEKFLAAVVSKLSKEDKDVLKDVKKLTEIDDAKLDVLSSDFTRFLEEINELATNKGEDICPQLNKIHKFTPQGGSGGEEKDPQEELKGLREAKVAADKAAAAADKAAAAAADKAVADKAAADANANAKAATEALVNAEGQIKAFKLKQALALLSPLPPTSKEVELNALKALGEKAGADGECEAQASNTNLFKNFGADMLKNFDAAHMGTSK